MVLNMSGFSRGLALVSRKYIVCALLVGVVAACDKNSSNPATSGLLSRRFHAPFITAIPPTVPAVGADHAFQPSAPDVQREPLTFSIENKPIRTTIGPSSAKQELEAYSLPTLVVVARRMPPRGPASSQ
jgi:hypothetical protein